MQDAHESPAKGPSPGTCQIAAAGFCSSPLGCCSLLLPLPPPPPAGLLLMRPGPVLVLSLWGGMPWPLSLGLGLQAGTAGSMQIATGLQSGQLQRDSVPSSLAGSLKLPYGSNIAEGVCAGRQVQFAQSALLHMAKTRREASLLPACCRRKPRL